MLLAPKSGRETRELIKDKVGEETAYLKQRRAVVRQAAAGWVDKSKEYINSFSRRSAT
jgi:gas vesicle protein